MEINFNYSKNFNEYENMLEKLGLTSMFNSQPEKKKELYFLLDNIVYIEDKKEEIANVDFEDIKDIEDMIKQNFKTLENNTDTEDDDKYIRTKIRK